MQSSSAHESCANTIPLVGCRRDGGATDPRSAASESLRISTTPVLSSHLFGLANTLMLASQAMSTIHTPPIKPGTVLDSRLMIQPGRSSVGFSLPATQRQTVLKPSNRHPIQLETTVTHRKQTTQAVSNRQKNRIFANRQPTPQPDSTRNTKTGRNSRNSLKTNNGGHFYPEQKCGFSLQTVSRRPRE